MATNDPNDDELLSAYLDDELSPDERTQVEARLRTDPRARQLVEQLRSLSNTLRALPRETLNRDLRGGIHAEVLQAQADAHARIALPTEHRSPITDHRSPSRSSNYRRGLIWSAITIAAALLLMVFQPEDANRDVREVAHADRKAEVHRENRRGPVAVDGTLPPQGEMRAFQPPQEAVKPIDAVAQSAAPTTIELAFVAPDAVARFERLLSEHEILLEAEPSADAELGGDKQLAGPNSPASAEKAAAVHVLVEASPAQIDALIAACQSDNSSFAYVRVPEPLLRHITDRSQSAYLAENSQLTGSAPEGERRDSSPQTRSELKPKNRDVGAARAWRPAEPRDAEPRNRAAPLAGQVQILFVLRPVQPPAAEPATAAP